MGAGTQPARRHRLPGPARELDPEADPGLLYAGQWQDAESGLCYNRFRYYEPESGMYLVSDPLGLQGVSRLTGMYITPMNLLIHLDWLHAHGR